MKRKKYLVGNWKMYKIAQTAYEDFSILQSMLETNEKFNCHIGICAPFVFLQQLCDISNHIHIYGQDVFWEKEGAFTGEISVPMLASIGATGSLVAHSERRQYFHETNETAGKKLKALFAANMQAIYCVGETLQERNDNMFESVIQTQLEEALKICGEAPNPSLLSIAYEPVWAIGTGKAATAQDALHMHKFIRATIAKIFGSQFASQLRILYGGSVKLTNIQDFLAYDDIDGALVGGASLNPKEFYQLSQKICT